MGEIEDLRKEIAELKAKKEVHEDFSKRDKEKKELQKEKFYLKHEGTIEKAKRIGRGLKRIGGGIKSFGENVAKSQKGNKSSGSSGFQFNNPFEESYSPSRKSKKGKRKKEYRKSSEFGMNRFDMGNFKLPNHFG